MAYLVANSPSPPLSMFTVNSSGSPRPNLLSVFNSTPRILPALKCSAISTPSLVDGAAKFQEASKSGNLIPLQQCIFADHLTPVLAYRCLVNEDDREAPSFLFESVEQGAKGTNVGRYSVIGAQPTMEIVAKENSVTIMDHEKGQRTEEFVEDPMVVPRRIMEACKPQLIDELPNAFVVQDYTYQFHLLGAPARMVETDAQSVEALHSRFSKPIQQFLDFQKLDIVGASFQYAFKAETLLAGSPTSAFPFVIKIMLL